MMAWQLCATPVVIGIALWFVLRDDGMSTPPTWALVAVGCVAAAGAGFIELTGYRVPALDPALPRDTALFAGLSRHSQRMILRFATAEVAMFVGIALAFVVESGGFWVYALGAGLTLGLFLWHVAPNDYNLGRTQRALERSGAVVPLRDLF